jgi:hypothetical protein
MALLGWLRFVFVLFLAMTLFGPRQVYLGYKQLRRINQVERRECAGWVPPSRPADKVHGDPGDE